MEILQIGFCMDHPICEQHLLPSIFISMFHFIWTCKWMMFWVTYNLLLNVLHASIVSYNARFTFTIWYICCKNIWGGTKMFLYLWHVWKAWAKNAIKKNYNAKRPCSSFICFSEIMYSYGCPIDTDAILWVE
jgi:hypothetical protein